MQKCQKRRTHFPLIALIFFVFIALTILYNESIIRTYDSKCYQPRSTVQDASLLLNHSNKPPVGLDKFTKCSSTVRYSGRRVTSSVNRAEFIARTAASGRVEACDLFTGKWVFDNSSYPLYKESSCPFMSDQLACQKHGRPDSGYQFWRWQPENCDLKKWNAVKMWEKLRDKRLMFVGDSLNRGQWISMLCLLHSVIPADKQTIKTKSDITIFRAEDYNATVEFLWAPFLVESNSDDAVEHRLTEKILRPDAILRHSSRWEKADILVFNSYLWWRLGSVKLIWSDEENNVCQEIKGFGGMELAMECWEDWVATRVDPLKKRVFFVTMSPTHQIKDEWAPGDEGNCYGEKEPIFNGSYWGSASNLTVIRMLEKVLSRLGSKVSVLNITQLSEYRKDGHPMIYRRFWESLGPDKLANPASYSDCIHWCLPGVPDVWNQLLFQLL